MVDLDGIQFGDFSTFGCPQSNLKNSQNKIWFHRSRAKRILIAIRYPLHFVCAELVFVYHPLMFESIFQPIHLFGVYTGNDVTWLMMVLLTQVTHFCSEDAAQFFLIILKTFLLIQMTMFTDSFVKHCDMSVEWTVEKVRLRCQCDEYNECWHTYFLQRLTHARHMCTQTI